MNPADYISAITWANAKQRSFFQTKLIYLVSNPRLLEYIAIGERGALTSEQKWVVAKFTYTANNMVETIKTSPEQSIADDYLTLTYS